MHPIHSTYLMTARLLWAWWWAEDQPGREGRSRRRGHQEDINRGPKGIETNEGDNVEGYRVAQWLVCSAAELEHAHLICSKIQWSSRCVH